jgi:hypothetical protein
MGVFIDYVRLLDFHPFTEETGTYCTEGFKIECKAGDIKTIKSISFPYVVGLMGGCFYPTNTIQGDYGYLYFKLKTNYTLKEDANQGDNGVYLPDGLVGLVYKGTSLIIDNDQYEVQYMYGTDKAVFTESLKQDYLEGTTIEWRIYIVKNYMICCNEKEIFNNKPFGCRPVYENFELVIEYNHIAQLLEDKNIYISLGYFYGEVV